MYTVRKTSARSQNLCMAKRPNHLRHVMM